MLTNILVFVDGKRIEKYCAKFETIEDMFSHEQGCYNLEFEDVKILEYGRRYTFSNFDCSLSVVYVVNME